MGSIPSLDSDMQAGRAACAQKLCWRLVLIWGALEPPPGPREGLWQRLWVLESHPLCTLTRCWVFAWRRTLSAGTRQSDKSPLQHPREMLRLLPGAEEGQWWEVVRYACSPPGTLASELLQEELELQSPFCPASFCCCLKNSLCMPQLAWASSCSSCPRRWQCSDQAQPWDQGYLQKEAGCLHEG